MVKISSTKFEEFTSRAPWNTKKNIRWIDRNYSIQRDILIPKTRKKKTKIIQQPRHVESGKPFDKLQVGNPIKFIVFEWFIYDSLTRYWKMIYFIEGIWMAIRECQMDFLMETVIDSYKIESRMIR